MSLFNTTEQSYEHSNLTVEEKEEIRVALGVAKVGGDIVQNFAAKKIVSERSATIAAHPRQ